MEYVQACMSLHDMNGPFLTGMGLFCVFKYIRHDAGKRTRFNRLHVKITFNHMRAPGEEEENMDYTTQMDAARKGILTEELKRVAEKELFEPAELMRLVAEGKAAIPANRLHTCLEPNGIGSRLKTKINVNLGTSRDPGSGTGYTGIMARTPPAAGSRKRNVRQRKMPEAGAVPG